MPRTGKRSAIAAFGLVIPLILLVLAVPRLIEGIAVARARYATSAALVGRPLSQQAYASAASILSPTLRANGDGLVRRAEMIALAAGEKREGLQEAKTVVIQGLLRNPID